MLKRPDFIQIYLNFAAIISRRSTCKRLQVGSVITNKDFTKVLAIGYNGNAKGFKNACDSNEPGKCGCIHSEINALLKLDYSEKEKILFVTDLPCVNCAKAIINAGIQEIYYIRDYRIKDSLKLFKKAKIKITKVKLKPINIDIFLNQ